jgi:sulfur-oxidizing protein SoxX
VYVGAFSNKPPQIYDEEEIMRKTARVVFTAASVASLLGSLALVPVGPAAAAEEKKMTPVEQGKQIAFDRKKGNCLACHQMDDGALPGNLGPPLISMKARYPDKAKLREQIADPTKTNANSAMPPFGKHNILTADEIDKIVEYVYTL